MGKFISSVFFLLILGTAGFSQGTYRHGYLFTYTHDTVHLKVFDQGEPINHHLMLTKTYYDSLGEEQAYYPSMIAGYQILPAKRYLTDIYQGRQVFYRVLVLGEASLLLYRDAQKTEYVYLKKEGSIFSLYTKPYWRIGEQGRYRFTGRKSEREVQQLVDSLLSNRGSWPSVRRDGPFLNTLARRVQSFNTSQNRMEYIAPSVLSNRPQISWQAEAGMVFSKVEMRGEGHSYFTQSVFQPREGFMASIAAALRFVNWNHGLVMEMAAAYQQKGMQTKPGNTYTKVVGAPPVPLTIKFQLDYLDLIWRVRYRWTERRVTPFFTAGLLCGFLLNTGAEAFYAAEGDNPALYVFDPDAYNNLEAGFQLGTGISQKVYKQSVVSLAIRYENTVLVGSSSSTWLTRNFSVVAGFSF